MHLDLAYVTDVSLALILVGSVVDMVATMVIMDKVSRCINSTALITSLSSSFFPSTNLNNYYCF